MATVYNIPSAFGHPGACKRSIVLVAWLAAHLEKRGPWAAGWQRAGNEAAFVSVVNGRFFESDHP
jgi:hypothetical protein